MNLSNDDLLKLKRYYGSAGELKDDAFLERCAQNREELRRDRFYPRYHFAPAFGDINDPNGLCYYRGRWHLFYQARPANGLLTPEPIYWGHAVSNDLVFWQDLPIALYPEPEDACFSGATMVEDGRVIASYYGKPLGSMIAVSDDELLLNWKKIQSGPVLVNDPLGRYVTFDSCIWKCDGRYYMICGTKRLRGENGRYTPAHPLFVSDDLLSWEYLHPFTDRYYCYEGDDGACPYFVPFGKDGRYLLFWFSHASGPRYMIGTYDTVRQKFLPIFGEDYGHGGSCWTGGIHAPSVFTKDGVTKAIFNVKAGHSHARGAWGQMMSLPQELYPDEHGDRVLCRVGIDTSVLHDTEITARNVYLPADKPVSAAEFEGDCYEMRLTVSCESLPELQIRLLCDEAQTRYTALNLFRSRRRDGSSVVSLDATLASDDPTAVIVPPENAIVDIRAGEPVDLRVFVDKSIVEVFVNEKVCLMQRVYPAENQRGIAFLSRVKPAVIDELTLWTMKDAVGK